MSRLLPKSLEMLVSELSRLPGVGERTALRYAVHLLKAGSQRIQSLEASLQQLRAEISHCPKCSFWMTNSDCAICDDESRSSQRICVVRDAPDVLALERFKRHPWKYHVLQGLLSPLSGVGPAQIRLEGLFARLDQDKVQELIIALDATVEGDATALYIRDYAREHFPQLQLSRTAMGLPAGASLEFLDPSTLESALVHRTPFL